jgi:hypothetical protein
MSELKVVTPEECTIPDAIKRRIVDDLNNVLTSGKRLYTAQRSHLEYIKAMASASGWLASAHHYDGDTVDVAFSILDTIGSHEHCSG